MRRLVLGIGLLLGAAVLLVWAGRYGFGPVVITREGEQKLILMLGDPRKVTQPGWDLRVPLLENARVYEKRLLYLNLESASIQTKDQERLVVDNYAVWRIGDPVRFYSSFPIGMVQAEPQIDRVVRASVRQVIGQHTLTDVLTDARIEIQEAITAQASSTLADSGIEMVDIRINRTELPQATEQNVFARMKTDRERLARKYRAEGEERARRIRAESDREARVIVANAQRDAQKERGIGDAEAARIYAEAHSSSPEFFAFLRSLEAYQKTIGDGTTLVTSPRSQFFELFEGTPAARAAQNGGAAGAPQQSRPPRAEAASGP